MKNKTDFPRIKVLDGVEKKGVVKKLKEQFGIAEVRGEIISKGKERLYLFSGNLEKFPLEKLEDKIIVEKIGMYFAKFVVDNGKEKLKLSIDGAQVFSKQISKNIFELENEEQLQQWMEGKELNIKSEMRGFVVIKYGEDFLGCGKASENKITNFVPKNRRLKEKI